jgi:hypothetical protein
MTDQIILDKTPQGYRFYRAWPYTVGGKRFGLVARYDLVAQDDPQERRPQKTKVYYPFLEENGTLVGPKGFPEPRPLYGCDDLAARPAAPVLIVEGEATADAAKMLFPNCVVITSPGGNSAAGKSDWSLLKNRIVIIWPDHDGPGLTERPDGVRASGLNSRGAYQLSP